MADLLVREIAYYQPMSIVGTDDQGRTVVVCPSCHDEAYLAEDGRVVCAFGEAQEAFLRDALSAYAEPTDLPADSPLRGNRG